MSIEALTGIVPPPAEPDEPFNGPWAVIEAYIGTPLPHDYKDFARLYGAGSFMEFLGVYLPMQRSPYVRLEAQIHDIRSYFLADEVFPYPLWPSPGGLIVCGCTDFGDRLFWLARGAPEDWKIVVWGRGLGKFEVFDCGLAEFLTGVAMGKILPEDFPEDLMEGEPDFKPYSHWGNDPPPPDWGPEPKLPVPAGWRARWRSSAPWRPRTW